MRSRPWHTLVLWMTVFAVAMAWLESAVVVYLRALYYPNGFSFPLVTMDAGLVVTEFGREVATLVMLFAPGALVAQRRMERFAWFLFLFGVWDIFYYVWLKVLLDWPASLNDPDILFLVPVPWIGPVWAPCLVSVGLVALAILILHRSHRNVSFRFRAIDLTLLIVGAATIAHFLYHRSVAVRTGAGPVRFHAREYGPIRSTGPWSIHAGRVQPCLVLCRCRDGRSGYSDHGRTQMIQQGCLPETHVIVEKTVTRGRNSPYQACVYYYGTQKQNGR